MSDIKELLNEAMDMVNGLNKSDGVNLKGKKYTKVVHRVETFRRKFGLEYGIDTEILPSNQGISFKASIKDRFGFVIGSGHAFTKNVAAEKSIEKLESTAIGRALASIGLTGGEYATESEIASWEERYEEKPLTYRYEPPSNEEIQKEIELDLLHWKTIKLQEMELCGDEHSLRGWLAQLKAPKKFVDHEKYEEIKQLIGKVKKTNVVLFAWSVLVSTDEVNIMEHQQFTMSMFLTKEDLYKAKAEYFEQKVDAIIEEIEAQTTQYDIDSRESGAEGRYSQAHNLTIKKEALIRVLGVLEEC